MPIFRNLLNRIEPDNKRGIGSIGAPRNLVCLASTYPKRGMGPGSGILLKQEQFCIIEAAYRLSYALF